MFVGETSRRVDVREQRLDVEHVGDAPLDDRRAEDPRTFRPALHAERHVGDVEDLVDDEADAFAAANAIRKDGAARGRCEGYCATSISNAIDVSSALLERFDGSAGSKIIDISASGTNNDGPPVALSRQRALGRGHIINAIAPPQLRFGISYHYLEYMTRNVIGGTGSFAVEPSAARDYAWTLRWKFQKEISSSRAPAGAYEVASDLVPARPPLRPFRP